MPFLLGNGIGFAGFYSKDIMIESAYGVHTTVGLIAFWLGMIAAGLTAFYSTRLMFMTFYGKYRGDHHTWDHAHESPAGHADPALRAGCRCRSVGPVAYDWFVGHDWHAISGGRRRSPRSRPAKCCITRTKCRCG